jgi:hypothetical protein
MNRNTSSRKTGKIAGVISSLMIMLLIQCMFPAQAMAAASKNSVFSKNTIPSSMAAGQRYTVQITVKNTGKETWTAAGGYALKAAGGSDPLASAKVCKLASGDSIKPKQSKTFTIEMCAPLKDKTCVTDWRMYKGSKAFGPTFTKRVKVTVAANNSLFISTAVPDSQTADADFTTTVTFKNIGAKKWTAAANYKLRATVTSGGSTIVFADCPLSAKDSVALGGKKTFSFTGKISGEGDYTFTYQLYAGNTPFGAAATRAVHITYTQAQLVSIATARVTAAEGSHLQQDFDSAQSWVDRLAACQEKAELQARLDLLRGDIKAAGDYLELLEKARAAVALAEKTRLQADADAAQALVSGLAAGPGKTALQNRLNAVQDILDAAKVTAEIAALPATGSLALAGKPAVSSARAHYNALSDAGKALVNNLTALTAAEARIAELEAAQDAAKALANAKDRAREKLNSAFIGCAMGGADSTSLSTARSNGYTAISAASSITDVRAAMLNAIGAVAQALNMPEEFGLPFQSKEPAHKVLNAVLADYKETDYTPENWAALNKAKKDGDDAIESAGSIDGPDGITAVKAAALKGMAAIEEIG